MPVGDDQLPMIEQTREIARKFNKIYGETFKLPEAKIGDFPRVLGMDGRKMGKSLNNSITFTDSPEMIKEKIKGALSDKIGGKNLLLLFEQFSDDKKLFEKFKKQYDSNVIKYSEFKPILAEAIIKKLKPIKEKREYYEKNLKSVEKILFDGTKKAQIIAKQTLATVK